ncbi:hypothetical protein FHS19_000340 [Paenibacillus rhizosphaerae]|uniref:FAD:protein FMN transferase n=1 Tax=Paenibacillus rhizosphaerae TaxID=297318 RepID=A0A839TFS4_9BACL|nr:FAD:protein FMN transferase [Paenibacillus rhizosphaerae]MBB3125686.1 hypothetical protein [Paenibacillus rhizosphaerae]
MHTFRAMNTDFVTQGLPEAEYREAESWFAFVEKHLTRFDPGSELSQLNRSAGRPFLATPVLYEAVSVALNYYKRADGLFNPFLGRLLSDLGYGRSFGEADSEEEVSSQASDRTEACARLLGFWSGERGQAEAAASQQAGRPASNRFLLHAKLGQAECFCTQACFA